MLLAWFTMIFIPGLFFGIIRRVSAEVLFQAIKAIAMVVALGLAILQPRQFRLDKQVDAIISNLIYIDCEIQKNHWQGCITDMIS